ncbi:cytochrome ubiquinol oxidase subunit I [Shigella flexneri]
MVACGFFLLAIIAPLSECHPQPHRRENGCCAPRCTVSLPWIAVEAGWCVPEYRRQPWAIGAVLPTAVANSSLTAGDPSSHWC